MSVMIKSGSGQNLAQVDAAGNVAVAVNNTAPLSVAVSNTAPLPVAVSNTAPLSVAVSNTAPLSVAAATALPVTAPAPLPVTAATALPVTAPAPLPVTAPAPLPVLVSDNARTSVVLAGVGLPVGASGAETALTLQLTRGAAITTGTSFISPAGRILRVQALIVTAVGNATATAYVMTVRLRYNPAGAVTTASPAVLPVRLSSPASAYGFTQAVVPVPDQWWLPAGDGTASYGFTVAATYSLNPPTVDVQLIGYEL